MTDTKTKGKNGTTSTPAPAPEPRQEIIEHVPNSPAQRIPAGSIVPRLETDMRLWPTNLDLENPVDKSAAFNAMGPADLQLNDKGEIKIVAHRFLLMPDSREDEETGEVKEFATLVLFDSMGRTYKTSSAWAWRRAFAAMNIYTPAEWDAGIPFVIRARMGQRKRMYHDIRIEAPR